MSKKKEHWLRAKKKKDFPVFYLKKSDFSSFLTFHIFFSTLYYISTKTLLMPRFIGSIDQGTTSTRFVIFNAETGSIVTFHQMEFEQNYPQPG